MITKVTGFIIHTTNYGETSLVIDLFTKELGIIGVMGKGVRSMKSKLRAYVSPFTYGTFYLYYKENKLSILKEVDIINPLTHIHEDITLISYLNYISDLSGQVMKEANSMDIFSLMIDAVSKMNEGLDPEVLVSILELKYLDYLGVGLLLDECISCGSKINIITIDEDRGGLICRNCYHGGQVVHPSTLKYLRMFHYVDIAHITKIDINKEIKKEINMFLNHYYSRYTGLYLQSKEFMNKLKKIERII